MRTAFYLLIITHYRYILINLPTNFSFNFYHVILLIVLQLFAQLEADQRRKETKKGSITSTNKSDKDKGFDEMNGVAAR